MTKSTLDFIAKYKFIYLLVSILLLLLIHPFFERLVVARILLQILDSAILVTAIYTVSQNRRLFIVGILLLLPAIIGGWSMYFTESLMPELVGRSFSALFLAFVTIVMMSNVFREQEVTLDTISGALCVYLLIGLTWTFVYSVLEFLEPGSFAVNTNASVSPRGDRYYEISLFLRHVNDLGLWGHYPIDSARQGLSYVEAIVGQIFVAVLIARLVGLHIVHSSRRNSH